MSQPIKSKKKQHATEINQSTQSMVSALLSHCYLTIAGICSGKLPKFSISFDLFSNSNENERFPTLSEEELANLGSENQNQNTSKSTNLAERKCSVAKRESWTEDIPRHELCRCNSLSFFAEIRKEDGDDTIVERRMPDSRSYKARSDTTSTPRAYPGHLTR